MTSCLADFVLADPPYRVARRLLLLAKRFGRREGEVVRVMHDLTLEEISLFAGVAPERSTQRCVISGIAAGSGSRTAVWRSWMGTAWPLFPRGR